MSEEELDKFMFDKFGVENASSDMNQAMMCWKKSGLNTFLVDKSITGHFWELRVNAKIYPFRTLSGLPLAICQAIKEALLAVKEVK